MSRYRGPITKLSRRLGVMLFPNQGKSKDKSQVKIKEKAKGKRTKQHALKTKWHALKEEKAKEKWDKALVLKPKNDELRKFMFLHGLL